MFPVDLSHPSTAREPVWHLCYRYWFWGWLFVDVNDGDRFRRDAAWHHNVRHRVHLPVYMRRWAFCLLNALASGYALETASSPPLLTAAFYVAATVGLVVLIVACTVWTLLGCR